VLLLLLLLLLLLGACFPTSTTLQNTGAPPLHMRTAAAHSTQPVNLSCCCWVLAFPPKLCNTGAWAPMHMPTTAAATVLSQAPSTAAVGCCRSHFHHTTIQMCMHTIAHACSINTVESAATTLSYQGDGFPASTTVLSPL
jgi:hypothetical protein